MKKFIALAVAGLAAFVLVIPTTFAAEFIAPDKDSGNITLSSGDKHHNTYVVGGTVFANSDVTGDLYAAGGTITIEGAIEQDAVIAGGTVTINGKVGGDVRVAGGTVTINSQIGGDLLVAGGTVILTEKASVGGDLAVGAGDVTVNAPIAGNADVGGGTVTLNSKVMGKVKVTADQSLVIGSKAEIAQDITYRGSKEATVQDGAKVGAVNFEMIKQPRGGKAGHVIATIFTVAFIIKLIGFILIGLVLMKLFPRTTKNAVSKISDKPWVNFGIGILFLIVTPILALVVLFTLVGVYFTLIAALVYGLLIILSIISSSIFVGSWIVKQLSKKTEIVIDWQALLIGVVLVGIASIIPFIGGLAVFIVMMMAFGAMLRMLSNHIKAEQAV